MILNKKKKKANKPKAPRRRILCRVKMHDQNDTLIVYRDGSCRWTGTDATAGFYWKLGHSDLGPMFLYMDDSNDGWTTDWGSNNDTEVYLATTIARALADLEMDNILKSDDGTLGTV